MREEVVARRRAEEARLREARGFHASAATATGDLVQKPVKPLTDAAYSRMIQQWDLFVSEHEGTESPLDIATLKRFLKWYCDGRKGRIVPVGSKNKVGLHITQNSAYSCWKSFMSAWHRRTGDTFSKSIQNTIETLIFGGDDNWLNLETACRTPRNFTMTDFQACVRQLWQNDWYDFRCEMYRVNLHLMMLLHAGTSARSAEYVINLRYRDTYLYQVWIEDRPQPQLVIDLCRNHTKGLANLPRKQPEHLLYELVNLPFYYNTTAFFVAGLLAVNGLRDFDSWSDVCKVTKPPDRNFVLLDYTDDILNRHVFSRYSDLRGGETKAATSLSAALGQLGLRTGFRDKPTPGAIRREALLQVDRHGYSINERMRHADHIKADTYGGYYQNAISTVDGQATYFGFEQQLPAFHELFRGFSIRRDHQFRPEVPLRLQGQLADSRSAAEGKGSIVERSTDRQARQKIYDSRRQQKHRLLHADEQQRHPNTAFTSDHCAYESDFQQARRLMPERNRLAETILQTGSLRQAKGIALMDDLVALYSSRNSDTYCVCLNGSSSQCDSCGVARLQYSSHSWWSHVYHCRKQQQEYVGRFSEFCFLCFEWLDDVDAWSEHTKGHYQDLPLKCSFQMFRGTVLRPGWCPDCVANTVPQGVEGKGLTQFLNVTAWKAHTDQHVHQLRLGPYKCAHPRCATIANYPSLAEYVAHRFDVHLIPPPDGVGLVDGAGQRTATMKAACAPKSTAGEDADDPDQIAPACSGFVSPVLSDRPPTGSEAASKISKESVGPLTLGEVANSSATGLVASAPNLARGGRDEENVGNNDVDRVSSAAAVSSTTGFRRVDERLAGPSNLDIHQSSSLSSDHSFKLIGSSEASRHRDREGFQGTPSRVVASGSTTIEVVIPLRPKGWDNVPIFDCTDRTAGQLPADEEDSFRRPIGRPQASRVHQPSRSNSITPAELERRSYRLCKRSTRRRNCRAARDGGKGSRALKDSKASEMLIRRRTAIAEMHARIRERQISRFQLASIACT